MTDEEKEKTKFLSGLESRSGQHLQRLSEGELNEAYIALDLMRAISSAHDGGIPSEEVLAVLPVKEWREDTVPIPFAFLRVLMAGWREYLAQQEMPAGKNLGQCLGIEGKFQGAKGIAKRARTRDRGQRLANKVVLEILLAEVTGQQAKVGAEIKFVADNEGVSEAAARKAYRSLGRPNLPEIRKRWKYERGLKPPEVSTPGCDCAAARSFFRLLPIATDWSISNACNLSHRPPNRRTLRGSSSDPAPLAQDRSDIPKAVPPDTRLHTLEAVGHRSLGSVQSKRRITKNRHPGTGGGSIRLRPGLPRI